MPDYFNKSRKEVGPELQGSVLRGILGSAAGMFVCILALLLCCCVGWKNSVSHSCFLWEW